MNKGKLNEELTELHKGLLSGAIPAEQVSELMIKDIAPEMHEYIDRGMKGEEKNFDDTERQNIFLMIQITQYLYNYSGLSTGLEDLDYDALYEVYINLGNEDIISVDLPFDAKETGEHTYPSLRGTLTKVYYLNDDELRTNPTRKYLSEWINSRERELSEKRHPVDLRRTHIYVFPKWDGCSCIFEFNPDGSLKSALTRGNVYTNVAQDITKSFPNMRGKVTPHGYGLKTEILMREGDLAYYNEKYGTTYRNTRSIVSSILNSETNDERNNLLVIQELRTTELIDGEEQLQKLADMAFVSPFIRCELGDTDKIREFALAHRYVDGLRCDGAVIYIINEELQKLLGREDNKNKYEVAYKFTEEATMSELKDVIFQVGLFGEISPVAVVKPVKLKGNTINRISLGSMQRFAKLKLRKGDRVKVLYDIIPYLAWDSDCSHEGGKKFKAPEDCPYCHMPLELDSEGNPSKCVNPDCDCRKKGAILNYLSKMGIKNISYATVDDFYDNHILRSLEDVYRLKDHYKEICSLDGYGTSKADAILNSIADHMNVPDYLLMGSIGIDGIGVDTFKLLLNHHPLDELMRLCYRNDIETLCKIQGVKEKKAKKIIKGILDREKTIDYLMGVLHVTHTTDEPAKFSVAFTKVRDTDIEAEIIRRGGRIDDSVKKTTTYLVVPNLSVTSTKVESARKNGTKIVPIDDIIGVIDREQS